MKYFMAMALPEQLSPHEFERLGSAHWVSEGANQPPALKVLLPARSGSWSAGPSPGGERAARGARTHPRRGRGAGASTRGRGDGARSTLDRHLDKKDASRRRLGVLGVREELHAEFHQLFESLKLGNHVLSPAGIRNAGLPFDRGAAVIGQDGSVLLLKEEKTAKGFEF